MRLLLSVPLAALLLALSTPARALDAVVTNCGSDADFFAKLGAVPQQIAGFPARLFNTPVRKTGLEDYLTREVARALERLARFDREGVARRRMSAVIPGQCILPRTATVVCETDCTFLLLSQRTFLGVVDQVPALAHKLLASLASRIRDLDRQYFG